MNRRNFIQTMLAAVAAPVAAFRAGLPKCPPPPQPKPVRPSKVEVLYEPEVETKFSFYEEAPEFVEWQMREGAGINLPYEPIDTERIAKLKRDYRQTFKPQDGKGPFEFPPPKGSEFPRKHLAKPRAVEVVGVKQEFVEAYKAFRAQQGKPMVPKGTTLWYWTPADGYVEVTT